VTEIQRQGKEDGREKLLEMMETDSDRRNDIHFISERG
jgi:hypothetical protein